MRAKVLALWVVAGCSMGEGRTDGMPELGDSTGGEGTAATTGPTTDAVDSTGVDPSMTSTEGDPTTDEGDTTEGTGACAEHWRVVRSEGNVTDLAVDEAAGRVYAIGSLESGESWAMALDACDGTVLADTTVAHRGADQTYLRSMAFGPRGLYATGNVSLPRGSTVGLYLRLHPDDLSTIWSREVLGRLDSHTLEDIVVGGSGRVWMTGTSSADAGGTTAWAASGNTNGAMACGFAWSGTGSQQGRAIALDGGSVVAAMRVTPGQFVLVRYDETCTCDCMPTWESAPIEVGLMDTSVADLVVVGGQYYVAGWANDGNTTNGLYLQLSWVSSMGAVIETYVADPSPVADGLLSMGADADDLYVAGAREWMGEPNFANATALIQALPLPLRAATQPRWEANPTDLNVVEGMGVEAAPDGYLYVGGNDDGLGVMLRCDKQGGCG